MKKLILTFAVLVTAIALFVAPGCRKTDHGKVVVLGLDGMDPVAVDLLMSEGKLPNFAKLRQDGAYGRFISSRPLLSPIIWTTIATGKTPDLHGIGHFVAVNDQSGEQLPVTSRMRGVKALWNIASEAGRSVGVVGWWATWPAEEVNGKLVSDHTCYHFLFPEGQTGSNDQTAIVWPPSFQGHVDAMVKRPGDLTPSELASYVNVSAEDFAKPFDFTDDLGHFKWALATAMSYRDIGLDILKKDRPDLVMTYIEGIDSSSHLFGHLFRAQGLKGELAEQQKRYGGTVEAMYTYADSVVGSFLDTIDDDTTLVVVSDHGFQLGVLHDDPSKTRDMRRVSERYHRIEGILYMYGHRVRPHSRIDRPTLVDVAPTVLTLAGIAPAADMPGRVLTEALEIESPRRRVASFETGKPTADGTSESEDPTVNAAILEKLKSLGYLDTQSPKGDRNMAAIAFEAGRFEEAVTAYKALVAANPSDGSLRASLGGALGALGRYDEAYESLTTAIELEPLNPEAYHNRALIHERRGEQPAAIDDYRQALRYRPDYAPAAQALVRLTGSADANPPRTDAERLASLLAQRAGDAARKGDYDEAMKQLDEAQRVAPEFAMVYQYRSNVAFLRGDRAGAIAALERALQLEPDNALYQTNLLRLRQAAPAE